MQYLTMLFVAFTMGFFGSTHCIGMCGGILSSLCYGCPAIQSQRKNAYLYQLCYHAGRISTYMLLGMMAGFTGSLLTIQTNGNAAFWLRVTSSCAIILSGFYITGWLQTIRYLEQLGQLIWRPLSRFTKYLIPIQSKQQAILLGALWGFLPCGLVYSALLTTISASSLPMGAAIMLAFGLGTLPALLLLGTGLQQYASMLKSLLFRRLAGSIVILLGVIGLYLIIAAHTTVNHPACCH